MGDILRHFVYGIGSAACLFPARGNAEPPKVGDYFVNAGGHIRQAIVTDGPNIRREAKQMELPLEKEAAK